MFHGRGANEQMMMRSQRECVDACMNTCLAVDYNLPRQRCFFYNFTANACGPLDINADVTHVSKTNCKSL